MKLLTTAALALALSAGVAATAQADPEDRGGHEHAQGGNPGYRGGPPGGGQHNEAPRFQRFEGPRFQGNPNPGPRFQGPPQRFERFQGDAGMNAGPHYDRRVVGEPGRVMPFQGQPQFERRYHGEQNWQGGQNRQVFERGDRGGEWNRGGQWHGERGQRFAGVPGGEHELRDRDRGREWFDRGRFPHEWHAEHRFWDRDDFYPRGWYYRTWYFGDYLPWGWYSPGFYLNWGWYDLPPPPIGCEWIREGHDAVLVDIWTGEILSVEYGVFW